MPAFFIPISAQGVADIRSHRIDLEKLKKDFNPNDAEQIAFLTEAVAYFEFHIHSLYLMELSRDLFKWLFLASFSNYYLPEFIKPLVVSLQLYSFVLVATTYLGIQLNASHFEQHVQDMKLVYIWCFKNRATKEDCKPILELAHIQQLICLLAPFCTVDFIKKWDSWLTKDTLEQAGVITRIRAFFANAPQSASDTKISRASQYSNFRLILERIDQMKGSDVVAISHKEKWHQISEYFMSSRPLNYLERYIPESWHKGFEILHSTFRADEKVPSLR